MNLTDVRLQVMIELVAFDTVGTRVSDRSNVARRVDSFDVRIHMFSLFEGLVAVGAGIRSLASMLSHVQS